ncbi:S26 family signal peptidase [Sutcliffiella rhizosphaerae]|uniref:Peptidase S26 domain-containing protein n=1 Tax=Sutcliffiella rhizosphaerae TaxID=2880967 RepID=A0ABM8YTL4_9BACI|nr:S26 family signal peptidase [Sutcliffiella rhizosphaerae]CAG9623305.1 hypothetical protein BACCIP111883_04106 [Sutcliffiella rhizosphaerae]
MGTKLRNILENTVLKNVEATEIEKEKLMKRIHKKKFNRPYNYKYIVSFAAAILISVVLLSSQIINNNTASNAVIVDTETQPEIKIIKNLTDETYTTHYVSENMNRGNFEYYDTEIVIEPLKNEKKINRGDILYFEDISSGYEVIARVVGLSGEKIKISQGQVYINENILDTFYGKAHRLGMEREEYYEVMDQNNGMTYNKPAMDEIFLYELPEIQLTENEYYVIPDDWTSGYMYQLNNDEIIGKVIGVKDK